MPQTASDDAYLWDMLDAATTALKFVSGMTFEDYSSNLAIQAAVERKMEVIGEAARRVSEEFKQTHPNIPWRSIVGLRNIIVHQYRDVHPGIVWRVVTGDLAPFIAGGGYRTGLTGLQRMFAETATERAL